MLYGIVLVYIVIVGEFFVNRSIYNNKIYGFTIVELLVVIVIIGILSAITMVSYSGITKKADIAALQSDLSNNSNVLKMYNATHGSFPTTLDSNSCPTAPVADTNYCLRSSPYTTLTYLPSSTTGQVTDFSLYAYKGTTYLRSTGDNGISQELTRVCPYGFIVVPGSTTYSTSDFCVMKYEAKILGNDNGLQQNYNTSQVAESRASGVPWVNISQNNAIVASQTACDGCHLITEAEWMTIAQNVLNNPINWSSGTVGDGFIYSGHNDSVRADGIVPLSLEGYAVPIPASNNDSDGYFGTGNSAISGPNQKRTLTLSNGEVIWDLAGNAGEYSNASLGYSPELQPGIDAEGYTWRQWNNALLQMNDLPVNSQPVSTGVVGITGLDSNNGIGRLYSSSSGWWRAYVRGGKIRDSDSAGVLSLSFEIETGTRFSEVGFRVAQ